MSVLKNMANRQVCDVDIRYRQSDEPFMYFDTANATTVGINSDGVFAMAKSTRRIRFDNPLDGTVTITAQVYPSKLFQLISGSSAKTNAIYAQRVTIACTTNGELPLHVDNATINASSVFAYSEGYFGDDDNLVPCTYASNKVTGSFFTGHKYEVGFVVTRESGVKKYEFNNNNPLTEYKFTMSTLNKDEDGDYAAFLIVVYRAIIERNFEISFSSEGEPAEVTITFSLIPDRTGRMLDIVEIADLSTFQPGDIALPYYVVLTDDDAGNVVMTFAERAVD